MTSLKGSKTEKNLMASFVRELQARHRYTHFASKAKKDGYVQISRIFQETANQENEHAKRLFKYLESGEVEITGAYPAGVIDSTLDNLKAAAMGEHEEYTEIYPGFAKVAREEGFNDIAVIWDSISIMEKRHGKRYLDLAENIKAGKVFKKVQSVFWRSRKFQLGA